MDVQQYFLPVNLSAYLTVRLSVCVTSDFQVFQTNTISYSTVVKAHAEARDVAGAEHRMTMMLKAGVQAKTISYSTAVNAHEEAHDMARAEHRMSKMWQADVQANAISYRIAFNTSAEARAVATAEDRTSSMLQAGVSGKHHQLQHCGQGMC